MQITVKSAKVGKTGTNKQGDWELIVVTADDGTDYTTFHKGAKHLTAGTVITLDEVTIKEEDGKTKKSFKEYTVVSAPAPGNGQSGMTPELWAEKDRLERWSRECNTCFMGLPELFKNKPPEGPALNVYNVALNWALVHLQMPQKSSPEAIKSSPAKEEIKGNLPEEAELPQEQAEPTTIQELLEWVASHGKEFTRTWVVNKCGISEDQLTKDPVACYHEIKELMNWED